MTRHRTPLAHAFTADQGADGPAAMARRWLDVPSDLPGVKCRQVIEPGPMAGLHLNQRQCDAAAALAQLWREALPGREWPAAFSSRSQGGRHLTPDEERAAGIAARLYQSACDAIQWQAGVRAVWAVEAVIIRRERADQGQLLAGLAVLADHFGTR